MDREISIIDNPVSSVQLAIKVLKGNDVVLAQLPLLAAPDPMPIMLDNRHSQNAALRSQPATKADNRTGSEREGPLFGAR
ncbi:hypothetical protein [Burkholderia ubonensis]|uniref:hypothetical protein n=1 Tax=Burkholderia ubonensis TaxID=101571 RepID=UPI0012FB33F9|nr:hypothetical protein [Burkholderia ubonensis]